MYWLNMISNGERISIESYDKCIEFLEFFHTNKYKILQDNEMKDVWWISINEKEVYMLTNCQPAVDIQKE